MKRRGFLGLLGGAAVVGPKGAIEALNEVGRAPIKPLANLGPPASPYAIAQSQSDYIAKQMAKIARKAAYVAINGGPPKHTKDVMWRQACDIHVLDSDLAAMRSMSNSVKVAIQRERNYQRLLDDWASEKWFQRDLETDSI